MRHSVIDVMGLAMAMAMALALVLIAISEYSNNEDISEGVFEEKLIEEANFVTASTLNTYFKNNPFAKSNRIYEVTTSGNNTFSVNVNGTIYVNKFMQSSTPHIDIPQETFQIDYKTKKIVKKSFKLVEEFIRSSKILKNKEDIIKFIKTIDVKSAYLDNEDNPTIAYFYGTEKEKSIVIEKRNENLTCEWAIVYELIHAISYYTHGQTMKYDYSYSLFNEVLTDLFTMSIDPKVLEGDKYSSGYAIYYSYIFPYISLFQEEALTAYFYGYEDFNPKIPNSEIDLFVHVIDVLLENPDIVIHFNNLILKWQYVITSQNEQEVGLLPSFLCYLLLSMLST